MGQERVVSASVSEVSGRYQEYEGEVGWAEERGSAERDAR